MSDEIGESTLDDTRPLDARVARPRLLGRYDLVRLLGEGGMGEVHECQDAELERTIALKAIRRDRQVRHFEARFVREACVQAQLEHPSIVPVFDVGTDETGTAFFTMRRISGLTLDEIIERKRARDPRVSTSDTFSGHRLLSAFAQVCMTVHYAHSRGVLHRDIKPSNIMLGEFGEVYVLDWGLAKLSPSEMVQRGPVRVAPGAHTVADMTMGTPAYMAPEQVTGRDVDARADVFALGAVLFEILTLERLLDDHAVTARLRGEQPSWDARPSARGAPPELDKVCLRATAKNVEARYPSARALHDQLQTYLDGERDHELRRTQARSLVERAVTLADWDEALRSVNRALALAPEEPRALRLLVQLLERVSPEIEERARAEVDHESIERQRLVQRIGTLLYGAPWVTLYPFLLFARGTDHPILATLLPLSWLVACAFLILDARRRPTPTRVVYPTALVMLAVSLSSQLFGPLVIVPAFAATCTGAHILVASRGIRRSIVLMGCIAALVPLGAVWLGLLDSYSFSSETTFTMEVIFKSVRPARLNMALMLVEVLMILSLGAAAYRFREAIERARTKSVLFAWQLSQLLPPPPPDPSSRSVRSPIVAADTVVDSLPLQEIATTLTHNDDGEAGPFDLPKLVGPRYVPTSEPHVVRDRVIGRDVVMTRGTKAEACLQARMDHPAVPPVYDIGRDDSGLWFTSKHVKGKTLGTVVAEPNAHPPHLLARIAKVCLAIDFAHEHGIVHRALSKETVILGEFGETYVLDWTQATLTTEDVAKADDVTALCEMLRDVQPTPEVEAICEKAKGRSARRLHDAIDAFLSSDRDEELRANLAIEHIGTAERKLKEATGSENDRVEVLREVGRALALTADRTPALSLLSRLLDSPPSPLPKDVEREIAAQVWQLSRRAAPRAALAYFVTFVAGMPVLAMLLGVRSMPQTIAIMAAWAIAAGAVYGQHVFATGPLRFPWAGVAVLTAVGTTSLLAGPHYLVPGLAVTLTTVYVLEVQPGWRRLMILLGCASVLVPSLLSIYGVTELFALTGPVGPRPTYVVHGALYHPPPFFEIGLILANIATVIAAGSNAAEYRDLLDDLETANRARIHGLSRLM